MKDLAPNIVRKRLLIEGYFSSSEVDENFIATYFQTVTSALGLRMYSDPIIFSPGGEGKEENQGYDAFVPLIDSGISVYVWSNTKFFSGIFYTCKDFDSDIAVEVTKKVFGIEEAETMEF